MAVKKPVTLDDMATIHGIGRSKLEKYGQVFLDAVGGAKKVCTNI
jgi:superfamily II DNA helicase RecQ